MLLPTKRATTLTLTSSPVNKTSRKIDRVAHHVERHRGGTRGLRHVLLGDE